MGITKELMRNHQKMEHSTAGVYLRHFIFGVEDGLIGALGLVTGISVATLNPTIIILSGLALMLTQAVSMGAGTLLSIRSQQEYYDRVLGQEKREIEDVPDIETQEVRDIYRKHGFEGQKLEDLVKKITSNKKAWLSVMMAEEFGLAKRNLENPGIATVVMALSVMMGAFIPLIPYFFLTSFPAIAFSIAATILGLLVFGAAQTIFTKQNPIKGATEMVVIGGIAAAAGYAIGSAFSVFV